MNQLQREIQSLILRYVDGLITIETTEKAIAELLFMELINLGYLDRDHNNVDDMLEEFFNLGNRGGAQ